jgi:hypothetical protein
MPRSSPSGSCEKRTVPSQQRPAFRYDATSPRPAFSVPVGQVMPGIVYAERHRLRQVGPGEFGTSENAGLAARSWCGCSVLTPSTQLPLWLTAQQFVRMRQRSAFSQGAELCHVRGRELEFVRMRQWSAFSQVRRSVFPKRRCIVRAKASGAIPCRAATDRA